MIHLGGERSWGRESASVGSCVVFLFLSVPNFGISSKTYGDLGEAVRHQGAEPLAALLLQTGRRFS